MRCLSKGFASRIAKVGSPEDYNASTPAKQQSVFLTRNTPCRLDA